MDTPPASPHLLGGSPAVEVGRAPGATWACACFGVRLIDGVTWLAFAAPGGAPATC